MILNNDQEVEIKCKCGCKKGWHHAKLKSEVKTIICYGIGCICEKYVKSY